jgi:type I restriction enzyme S subunit
MKPRSGYGQTEVGIIPEEWEVKRLGEVFTISAGRSKSAYVVAGGRYWVVDMGSVSTDGRLIVSKATNYCGDFLRVGDLVMPKDDIGGGGIIGKVGYIDAEETYVLGDHVYRLTANLGNPLFLSYVINGYRTNTELRKKVIGSAQLGLARKSVEEHAVPFPSHEEQTTIAEALTDSDALIESLEQVLAKKRQLKQGAMQELLTGRRRLPGFGGDWDTKRIGEFAGCTAGGTPSTGVSQNWGGAIRWMNSGELHLKMVAEVEGRITEEGLRNSSTKMLPARCVLIGLAGQGKTRGTVAMNLVPLCTNQSIATILPNASYASEFLYHNLESRYDELRELSSGEGGRGGLNLTIIRQVTVPFPSLHEQTSISSILSDMDAEIAALEAKLAKARHLKQGMMQELLTGRIRLV